MNPLRTFTLEDIYNALTSLFFNIELFSNSAEKYPAMVLVCGESGVRGGHLNYYERMTQSAVTSM